MPKARPVMSLFRKKRPVMPCGIRRSRMIASASIAISPITGVRGERHELVDRAEDRGARQRAGDDRRAAGDHGDERLGDVGDPDDGSSPVSGASTPPASPDSAAPTVKVTM